MARREVVLRFECGHPDCREVAHFRYASRREATECKPYESYGGGKWRCVRHSKLDEVLSMDNMSITTRLVSDQREYGVFWGSFGFVHGPGFKAFCKDFPPGTELVVTATINLPDRMTTQNNEEMP